MTNEPHQSETATNGQTAPIPPNTSTTSPQPGQPVAHTRLGPMDEGDDVLLRLQAEMNDEYPLAVPPTSHPRSTIPTAPSQSGSPRPAAPPRPPRARGVQVRATLERREEVRGPHLGEKHLRMNRPDDQYFKRVADDELVVVGATPPRDNGSPFRRARIAIFGQPLTTSQQIHERLTKVKALAVLSSDAISSVAYATEASLAILITAGLGALFFNPWIAGAIALLMIIVGTSYWQTIHAYPSGGGSYIVARDNMGDWPGLIAAAALLIDYVLTVSVSVSAGVDAIVTLDPKALSAFAVPAGVVFILLIMVVNLRGVRESGTIFSAPTYLFITCFLIMIITGFVHAALTPGGLLTPIAPHIHPFGPPLGWESSKLSVLLVLTAFASGCSAMTGVEAISNGVPAFHAPEAKNAARTLIVMVATLVTLFLGTTYLAWRFGIEPYNGGEPTVTGQIAYQLFYGSPFTRWFYFLLQISTTLILILAANTSYADFPRLASILARDGWLPKGFSFRGNRLAFSGGIVALTALAIVLTITFSGNTEALINLYALGVFTAFTLSQSGMVVHWWRLRARAGNGWQRSMVINSIGAFATGIVALVIIITKFDRGAWIVVVLVPLVVFMFRGISRHYTKVRRQISALGVRQATTITHAAIVPIARMDRVAERTLAYARSLIDNVTVVHITTTQEDDGNFRDAFHRWEHTVEDVERERARRQGIEPPQTKLVVIQSQYRALVPPFLEYVRRRRELQPDALITIFLPEYVPAHFWERLLHNETALRLKLALYAMRSVVVTNVPYHLAAPEDEPEPEEPVRLARRKPAPPSSPNDD